MPGCLRKTSWEKSVLLTDNSTSKALKRQNQRTPLTFNFFATEPDFETLMKESDCSKGAWFREKGWDDFSVKLDFDVFLWNKLKETLTKEDLERPDFDDRISVLEIELTKNLFRVLRKIA